MILEARSLAENLKPEAVIRPNSCACLSCRPWITCPARLQNHLRADFQPERTNRRMSHNRRSGHQRAVPPPHRAPQNICEELRSGVPLLEQWTDKLPPRTARSYGSLFVWDFWGGRPLLRTETRRGGQANIPKDRSE